MTKKALILAAMAAVCSSPLRAAPIDIDLLGNSVYDGWSNLTVGGGYSGVMFPGTAAWPTTGNWTTYNPGTGAVGAIGSNTAGSADALLYKIANGPAGGPYPAGGSIYFGGASAQVNLEGGTLGFADASPLTEVKTVTFQVEIGEAFGYDFYDHTLPVLTYKTESGSVTIEASYSDLISQVYSGDIPMPSGTEDIYKNTWGLQFDLSGVTEEILSYEVSFAGVQHAQLYSAQMNQTDHSYGADQAFPQAFVWDAGGGDSNWSTAANWTNNNQDNTVPATGREVQFSSGTGVVLDSNQTVGQLTLDAGNNFTISSTGGSVLTVGANGITASSPAPADYTISSQVAFSDFNLVTVGENNSLTFSNSITAPGFYKKGGGDLILAGNNTFAGNSYNRLIIVGGENSITGTNINAGPASMELYLKDAVVTLHGGDNRLGDNFSLNLYSRRFVNGATVLSEENARLVLGDVNGKSDQSFNQIVADKVNIFNEATGTGTTGTDSNSSIVGGSSAISTITINNNTPYNEFLPTGFYGKLGGAGTNENNLAIIKRGTGVQILGGTSTYTGDTVIENGVLRIDSATALSQNSNLKINGGVLGLGAGNYSADLGTGAGQVQFLGDAGFAGYNGVRTVTLNGGAALAWGSGGFVADGNRLILGHSTANNTVELANAVALGSQNRTILVNNGSGAVDGRLNGVVSGTGGLDKTGDGTLELTAANTYTGGTAIKAGNVTLTGANGAVKGDVVVEALAILQLTNTAAANNADRLEDNARITLNGGGLTFSNPTVTTGSTAYVETFGELALNKAANTITTSQAGTSGSNTSTLTMASLTRQSGATVNFNGTSLGVSARNRVIIANQPALDDGLIGAWATVGNEFAAYGANGVTALAGYTTSAESTWTAANNVKTTAAAPTVATTTLTADRQINSLNMVGATGGTFGNVMNLAGNTLRVESGGILVSGGNTSRSTKINNGTLTAGTGTNTPAELIVTANGAAEIGATITDNGSGSVSLVKAGGNTLTTTGNNTYTGGTTVNQGTLNVNGNNTGGGSLAVRRNGSLNINGSLLVGGTVEIDGFLGGNGSLGFATGSTLTGSGFISKSITVGSGAGQLNTLSPGNSPGTQTFTAAQTWADGGTYVWELADTDAGAGTGWDWVNITSGILDITAALPGSFTLQIVSLDALFAEGLVADFNASEDYVWTIASAAGGITGFDAGLFNLDVSGFANSHDGTFSLSQSGNNLNLSYTAAVPEPSTYVLLGLGGLALWALRRKAAKNGKV